MKPKEPDEPIKKILEPYHFTDNFAVAGTASVFFTQTGIGRKIGQLDDGRGLYYFNPKNIDVLDGKFTVIDKEGNKTSITFEI